MGQLHRFYPGLLAIGTMLLFGCSTGSTSSEQALLNDATVAPFAGQLNDALNAEFARLGIDPQKVTASAPSGENNAVVDLTAIQFNGDATPEPTAPCISLSWTERLAGDYDQNGEVSISDLSALGQNFGRSVDYLPASGAGGATDWPSGSPDSGNYRLARVDGDGNGVINISDVTAIAQHFQQRLDGYRIYRKGPGEESFSFVPNPGDPQLPYTIGRDSALGGGATAVRYEFDDLVSAAGGYDYYVSGWDNDSGTEGHESHAHGGDGPGGGPGDDPIIEFAPPPAPDPDPLPDFEGSILLIRNDNGTFNVNYDAITSDLDDLSASYDEVDYYDGVDEFFLGGGYDLAIWYRGGPGGSDTTLQQQAWTEAEISNIHDILADDGNLLLMSQNHSTPWPFDGTLPNGWDADTYYDLVMPYTVPIAQDEFARMEGFHTDDGVGYGGTFGYLPTAPMSVVGLIESDRAMEEYSQGRTAGEYFTGSGSSGSLPFQLKLPQDSQFSARSYNPAFFAGACAKAGFNTGLGFLPYELAGQELVPPDEKQFSIITFASWGCTNAPYTFTNGWPSYEVDSSGNANYWVIGYAWNDVEIVDDPDGSPSGMVRAELLLNTLAWLIQ